MTESKLDCLHRLGTEDLIPLFEAGTLSPVDVARACLARISELNPVFGAYCLVDEEAAIRAARESEARWQAGRPLSAIDGIPASIKDLCLTRGWPTWRGSRLFQSTKQDWSEDAPVSARLREAGAVLLGKTTTPELGWKAVTDNPRGDVARNPYDPGKTAGGSSGGAAAAAVLGMGVLHVGTDGGGSIRIPAAFCGAVGLKPTYGMVPAYPASAFGDVAHVGPITRTVTDALKMMEVITGPDARDPQSVPGAWGLGQRVADADIRKLRFGYSPDLGYVAVAPDIRGVVDEALERLRSQRFIASGGALDLGDPVHIFHAFWFSGAAQALRDQSVDALALCDPGLLQIQAAGKTISHMDYLAAQAARASLREKVSRYFNEVDILITPAMPITAFEAGREVPPDSGHSRWTGWTGFTYPFNLTQNPAAVIPCGLTPQSLPVSLQIVGPRFSDALVLQVAQAMEKALGTLPAPDISSHIEDRNSRPVAK